MKDEERREQFVERFRKARGRDPHADEIAAWNLDDDRRLVRETEAVQKFREMWQRSPYEHEVITWILQEDCNTQPEFFKLKPLIVDGLWRAQTAVRVSMLIDMLRLRMPTPLGYDDYRWG